jgi:hypothetical protein
MNDNNNIDHNINDKNDESLINKHDLLMKITKLKQLIHSADVRLNSHHKALSNLQHVDEIKQTRNIIAKLTAKILSEN